MGQLANNPKMYNELEASVTNLNAMTAGLRKGRGQPRAAAPGSGAGEIGSTQTTTNLESVTGKINRGEGTAGKLITDDELYKRLDSMTARLDTVLQNLNNGQGTAGQLLHDKQLYENMNKTITEIRALMAEISEGSEEVPQREGQHFLITECAE